MGRLDIRQVRQNRKKFRNYCKLRIKTAYAQNPDKAAVAFEVIPALLSVNVPELPGFIPHGDAICGVYDVGSSSKIRCIIKEVFPDLGRRHINFQKYLIQRPVIESLFLIGSTGTVAQSDNSDFDYWVCYDSQLVPRKWVTELHRKTDAISRWCQRTFDMEVHFFVSDLKQIRRNDFGQVDEESTGSSQRKFLKEECYRTMLLVAGKIPFWWVSPPGIEEEDYNRNWRALPHVAPYDCLDFLDLGYLGEIPKEELLGTTLWQLSKGLKDPFKALIKMTMMERYLFESYRGPLLCDVVKNRVLQNTVALRQLDPYLLMIESALAYYTERDQQASMELLREAFYIKADPQITRQRLRRSRGEYKTEVFRDVMHKWDWSAGRVEKLNHLENWGYARHLQLSHRLNKFFLKIYARLKTALPQQKKQVIEANDLMLLKRKLSVYFSKAEHKLQVTPFVTQRQSILKRCIFRFHILKSGQPCWSLYDATRYPFEQKEHNPRISAANRVSRIAAWLVNNGLYHHLHTAVEMTPNASGVNVNDLIGLLKHLHSFFKPAAHQTKINTHLEQDARYAQIMVVVDLEKNHTRDSNGRTIDLVYKNTWGEMFTETCDFNAGLNKISQYVSGLNAKDAHSVAARVKIHLPLSRKKIEERKLLKQAILYGLSN